MPSKWLASIANIMWTILVVAGYAVNEYSLGAL